MGKFPISDDEVMEMALKWISEYAASHSGNTVNFYDCMQGVLDSVKVVYWKYRKKDYMYRRIPIPPEQPAEYQEIFNRICEPLYAKASKRITSLMKSRKMSEINATTASVLISSSLHERGLTYAIETQKYRAKVHIKMEKEKVITFIIMYKEINAGLLDEILDSIVSLMEEVTTLGREIQIWRNKRSRWLDWKEAEDGGR